LTPVTSWMEKMSSHLEEIKTSLFSLFEKLMESSVYFVRTQCPEPVPTVDNNLVRSCCNILDALFLPLVPIEGVSRTEEQETLFSNLKSHVEALFLLSLIWSVGASTNSSGREKFSSFLSGRFKELGLKEAPPVSEEHSIYDFFYDLQQEKWILWIESRPPYKFDERISFSEMIIPTADSIRNMYFLDILSKQGRHVLFTGETGTGKTVNVQQYLSG